MIFAKIDEPYLLVQLIASVIMQFVSNLLFDNNGSSNSIRKPGAIQLTLD